MAVEARSFLATTSNVQHMFLHSNSRAFVILDNLSFVTVHVAGSSSPFHTHNSAFHRCAHVVCFYINLSLFVLLSHATTSTSNFASNYPCCVVVDLVESRSLVCEAANKEMVKSNHSGRDEHIHVLADEFGGHDGIVLEALTNAVLDETLVVLIGEEFVSVVAAVILVMESV